MNQSSKKEINNQYPSKVRLIILIYSKHSPSCVRLRKIISDDHFKLFQLICIDSPELHKLISNADNIKIKQVPAFILIYDNNTVLHYEGERAFSWYQSFATRQLYNMKQAQQKLMPNQPPSEGLPVSSVDRILNGLDSHKLDAQNPEKNLQSQKIRELNLDRPPHDIGSMKRKTLEPYRHNLSSDRDIMGMDGPDSPVKGSGHEDMAKSSISGMGRDQELYNTQRSGRPLGINDEQTDLTVTGTGFNMNDQPVKMKSLYDVTDNNMENSGQFSMSTLTDNELLTAMDNDPSGMKPIDGRDTMNIPGILQKPRTMQEQTSHLSGRGKEKGKEIKATAAAMAAQRDQSDESLLNKKGHPSRMNKK